MFLLKVSLGSFSSFLASKLEIWLRQFEWPWRVFCVGCQVYALKTLVYSVVFHFVWICQSPIRLFQTISLPMGNLILCIKFSSADYLKMKGEHSKEKLSKFPHFIVVSNSLGKYSKISNFLVSWRERKKNWLEHHPSHKKVRLTGTRIFLKVGPPTLHGEGRQHSILPNFPKNWMKLKEFGPPGARVLHAPLRSATVNNTQFRWTSTLAYPRGASDTRPSQSNSYSFWGEMAKIIAWHSILGLLVPPSVWEILDPPMVPIVRFVCSWWIVEEILDLPRITLKLQKLLLSWIPPENNANLFMHLSIVGSVVECSPATRAARVRFPDDANFRFFASKNFVQAPINRNSVRQHAYHWQMALGTHASPSGS